MTTELRVVLGRMLWAAEKGEVGIFSSVFLQFLYENWLQMGNEKRATFSLPEMAIKVRDNLMQKESVQRLGSCLILSHIVGPSTSGQGWRII